MHRGNIIPLYCFQVWPAGFDGVAYETCRELTKSSSCSMVSPTRPFVRCNVSPYESIYILFRLYFLMKVTCSSFFMSCLTCLNYATCLPLTKPCESNIVLFYIGIDIVLGCLCSFWLRLLTTWHWPPPDNTDYLTHWPLPDNLDYLTHWPPPDDIDYLTHWPQPDKSEYLFEALMLSVWQSEVDNYLATFTGWLELRGTLGFMK